MEKLKGFIFSWSEKQKLKYLYPGISLGVVCCATYFLWIDSNRTLNDNIKRLSNNPYYYNETQKYLAERELQRQLEFQRRRWFPLEYPPCVDWHKIEEEEDWF